MTLSSVAAQHTTSPSTNLFAILQALVGGDLIRYSFSWRHLWLLGVLSLLAFAGMGFRPASGSRTFTFYYVVQCILPVALFFGIFAPLFGVNLILTEAKQFMVLLPAWFVLVAQGTEQVWHINPARLIRSVLVGAYTIALIASIISLQRYWETPKSPEGLAVLHVRDQKQPDDAVISLHYSLDAALSFYMPETTSYTKPQQHEDGYLFTNDTYVLPVQLLEDQIEPSISLATIQNHPRIWVLSHSGKSPDMVQAIAQDCVVGGEWTYRPFRVTLLHSCTSSS
jgi:hypothetical protein